MTPTPEPASASAIPTPVHDEPSRAIVVKLPRKLAPFARTKRRWRAGCEVTVLRDGVEAYPAMLEAIAGAKRTISLETYILSADAVGDRFRDALIERADAGVAVRVIYDAVGSYGLPERWANGLRSAGIEVLDFNPIAPWRRKFRLSHRDHRKILVVDDEVGFTGGLNIATEYLAAEDGSGGWHDMHCRVTGPIVYDLARMFRRTWIRAGGKVYRPIPPTATAPPGTGASFVHLLDNTLLRHRGAIHRAYLHVINEARISISIQNAYFLPEGRVRRALVRAARRGVAVQIMVPKKSDVRLVAWAGLYVLRNLSRYGVQILRWRGPMLHAKTATVDKVWSTIGSFNFDAQSRLSNLEVNVEILDPEISQALSRAFEQDAENCEPYNERVWKDLPLWTKGLAWLSYQLRRFL